MDISVFNLSFIMQNYRRKIVPPCNTSGWRIFVMVLRLEFLRFTCLQVRAGALH